jgi:hypothetical protein
MRQTNELERVSDPVKSEGALDAGFQYVVHPGRTTRGERLRCLELRQTLLDRCERLRCSADFRTSGLGIALGCYLPRTRLSAALIARMTAGSDF